MDSLAGYASSDEEEEVKPERPNKVAKIESSAKANLVDSITAPAPVRPSAPAPQAAPSNEDVGPAPGPLRVSTDANELVPDDTDSAPFSPYTFERQRLRELTMPTVPNFDIPDSPPPPIRNSEEAAALAATTKKFEHFLELKRQGTHFNERLLSSSSLRNPSLLPKLMDFAGVSAQDSYRSALPDELAVPPTWPDDCYVESLLRHNERKEKKRLADREKLDFVPASKSAISSTASAGRDKEQRKSKFGAR